MKVLIACETSGVSREAFRLLGHDTWSCDLLPSDDDSEFHIQSDVRNVLNDGWDLMIAHPDCTFITNSGVSHLYKEEGRWDKLNAACGLFRILLNADIHKIAIENPIPHGHAVQRIGRKYDQIIQPYQFGHPERKATCLWLKNLPKLVETNNVREEMLLLPKKDQQRIHYMSPGPNRWKERSKTFQGIGDAFAAQWG